MSDRTLCRRTDLHPTVRRMVARSRRAHLACMRAGWANVGPDGAAGIVHAAMLGYTLARLCDALRDEQTHGRTHLQHQDERPSERHFDAVHNITPARGPCQAGKGSDSARRESVSGA